MAVYTDGKHLIADDEVELHQFAVAMGLRREWFQDHPRHPHYDLTTARAARRAEAAGAIRLATRSLINIIRFNRTPNRFVEMVAEAVEMVTEATESDHYIILPRPLTKVSIKN